MGAAEEIPLLLWLAVLLFSFAFVWVVRKLVQALFAPIIAVVGFIPKLGPAIEGALQAVEQKVTNALGAAESSIDHAIGASFHAFIRLNEWMWREFKAHAATIAEIASGIYPLVVGLRALKALVHRYAHTTTGSTARIKHLERELHGIEHDIKKIERDLSKGIGDDVLPRLKSLDKELHTVTTKTIPAIQAAEGADSLAIGNLWTWVKRNVPLAGSAAFAGAVALALGLPDLSLFKCPSWLNSVSKRGCGLWQGLEDLFGLLIDALVFVDLCQLLPEAEKLFGDVEAPLVELISTAANAACAQPPASFATFAVPTGPTPPAFALGPFGS